MNIIIVFIQAILIFISSLSTPITNLGYWCFNFSEYNSISYQKTIISKNINNIEDIKTFLYNFNYTKDSPIKYRQYISTTINRNYKGDCEDFAFFSKWLFDCINIDSEVYYLVGKGKWKHAVCITKDKKYMINGNLLYEFKSDNFKNELYNYFDKHYKYYYKFQKYKIVVRKF